MYDVWVFNPTIIRRRGEYCFHTNRNTFSMKAGGLGGERGFEAMVVEAIEVMEAIELVEAIEVVGVMEAMAIC